MQDLVRGAILYISLALLVGCTQHQNTNNEHVSAPQVESQTGESRESSLLAQGLQDLQISRGAGVQPLRDFFESYLTETFFLQLARERNPADLRSLSEYHRRFHQYSLENPGESGRLGQLSYDYYQRLVTVCADEFNTCSVLALYTHSVYAGNVFLLADPNITEAERERYILFVTNIGYPQNNRGMVERQMQAMIEDISDDTEVDIEKIQRLTNTVLFLSLESQSFPQEPVNVLYDLVQRHPTNDVLVGIFEQILQLSLNQNPQGPSLQIAKSYISEILQSSGLEEIIQSAPSTGLIQWKGNLESFSVANDWQLYYVLYGFMKSQYSGDLHSYFLDIVINDQDNQQNLLHIAESYIFKKFVINTYLSHERLGSLWQEEFERFGKVEPMFEMFFPRADSILAEIWNVNFKSDVDRLISEITPFYTTDELSSLKSIEVNLEKNIATIVAYPVQFIAGYFASQQGDFDFQFFVGGGFTGPTVVHLNDIFFFQQHFEGMAPVMFEFVTETDMEGLDGLQSFYISLDERILEAYGLDLQFTLGLVDRYFESEKQFILDKNRELQRALSAGSSTRQHLNYCQRLQAGNNNFSYSLPFQSADNRFFMGQVYQTGGGFSFGTTSEMVDLINVFSNLNIKSNLTESMETLRLEIGIKLNRMQLMKQALLQQGKNQIATQVELKITEIKNLRNTFFQQQEEEFLKAANCLVTLEKTEETMRLEYFSEEIKFAKATYHALNLLNQNPNQRLTVSQAQQMAPNAFNNKFLKDLSDGDLVEALNSVWLGFMGDLKDDIRGYQDQITPQLGFRKNTNGQWTYFSNSFEQRFRLLHHIKNSPMSGVEFPRYRLNGLPRDYEELDLIFGEGDDHFFTLEKVSNETEGQFVFKMLTRRGFRRSGHATQYLLDGTKIWRTLFLNLASIAKTKAFKAVEGDFNYSDYPRQINNRVADDFATLADFTNQVLDLANISQKEKQILQDIQATNFRRDDILGAGGPREPMNALFFYNNSIDFQNLGQYDVYFSVLVAYQLGKHAEFIPGLYGSGPQHSTGYDMNPLLWDWIPRSAANNTGPNSSVTHIDAEEVFGRRNIRRYSESNSVLAKKFDEINLFAIGTQAKQWIFHDLYQAVMANRVLVDTFVEWAENRSEPADVIPYQMDLYRQPEPVVPSMILPSIRDRYYDYRQEFDHRTINIFKELEVSATDTEGPQ